jgi:hypothetical protein
MVECGCNEGFWFVGNPYFSYMMVSKTTAWCTQRPTNSSCQCQCIIVIIIVIILLF